MATENNEAPEKESYIGQDGQAFEVDVLGSLGILAYGYRGLNAWREHRRKMNYKNDHLTYVAPQKKASAAKKLSALGPLKQNQGKDD